MKIFLTGASGFIGSHVLTAVLQAGHSVRALVRKPPQAALPDALSLEFLVKTMDAVEPEDFEGCDALMHLAAYGVKADEMNDWDGCFRVNVVDSLRLWRMAAEAGVRRFLVCGSCFEYGRSGERYEFIPVDAPLEPTGAYHSSKAAATMAAFGLAVDRGLEMVIARPFHVYGEGESAHGFWPSLKRAAEAGDNFLMSSGDQVRDFVQVSLVAKRFVDLCSLAALEPGAPLVVNVGSGCPKSLRDFAQEWWALLGAKGDLNIGGLPQRRNEVMRFVPKL